MFVYTGDEASNRRHFTLGTLQLWDTTEGTLTDAPPGCVSEVSIANRITIGNLIENAVIGNQFLYRCADNVVGSEITVIDGKLEGKRRRLVEKALDKAYSCPAWLMDKIVEHQRGRYPADKDSLCLPTDGPQSEIDGGGCSLPFETKESGYINPVPCLRKDFKGFTFYEMDIIVTAMWAMISSNLHQAKWGIFIWISRFDEQNILLTH